jgi:hypothetical protein
MNPKCQALAYRNACGPRAGLSPATPTGRSGLKKHVAEAVMAEFSHSGKGDRAAEIRYTFGNAGGCHVRRNPD